MEFTPRELQVIFAALSIAAEQYQKDAQAMATPDGSPRLVAQFNRQVDECNALVNRIGEDIGA